MRRRVVNVESGNGDAPGFVLDVYVVASAYRGEVRDPDERVIMAVSGATLDGDSSVLESVVTYFATGPNACIGKGLVEAARAELKMSGADTRAAVPGWEIAQAIGDALLCLGEPTQPAETRLTDVQIADIAARAAVAVRVKFDVREKS